LEEGRFSEKERGFHLEKSIHPQKEVEKHLRSIY